VGAGEFARPAKRSEASATTTLEERRLSRAESKPGALAPRKAPRMKTGFSPGSYTFTPSFASSPRNCSKPCI